MKNAMICANVLSNFVAVFFVNAIIHWAEGPVTGKILPLINKFDNTFTILAFSVIGLAPVIYEKPIRQCLAYEATPQFLTCASLETARRRLLNEPYFLLLMDLCIWLLAAVLYPVFVWYNDFGIGYIHRYLYMSLSTGLITIVVAFFLTELLLQKQCIPVFFPNGGLDSIRGTLRIRIGTRLGALLFASNLIPLFSILHIVFRFNLGTGQVGERLSQMSMAISVNVLIYITAGLLLTMLVTHILASPFLEITDTLSAIKAGNFTRKVRVISNDEIGYTGECINEMADGLRDRANLRESLKAAMDIQQNLMPKADPDIDGLDIAGTSIYCEQTGGDYYDFLVKEGHDKDRVGIIVGDVSDHGIQSALLMTTGRALLRQRSAMEGGLVRIVTDVNKRLCEDIEESGRFMTLFYCEVDRLNNKILWVNAGHDPALIYDPESDQFAELGNGSLPLGIFEDVQYCESSVKFYPGQMIIIGTDGIWESRNAQGNLFGKKRFRGTRRSHACAPAREVVTRVISALDSFTGTTGIDDDITLVVAKVVDTSE